MKKIYYFGNYEKFRKHIIEFLSEEIQNAKIVLIDSEEELLSVPKIKDEDFIILDLSPFDTIYVEVLTRIYSRFGECRIIILTFSQKELSKQFCIRNKGI